MQYLVDEFEKSLPPMGHPLRKLGVRLTELLDEDQWAECDRLLLEGWEHDAADTRSDIQNLEASRDGYRDDARALHDALTRMVAMYESEFDHEDTYQWRPDWLKSALARRNALEGNHDNQD